MAVAELGAQGTAYLSLIEVAKSYDGRNFAVDRVSLDIRKGEFVTFLGPSGSGKTTTLTMIAGFEIPTQGRILLAGRDLTELQPWRRNIGMVFQNYALFPHMTVARNVAFPLRMRGIAKDEIKRRVDDVLTLVGLRTFSERHPRELSGGQQQRVALARGLVFRPDVLLLDEPLGALDKNLREQMQGEIKRIHREVGITMIYVTHDQSEAMTMSDRIAVFNAGRIEQVGSPLDIYCRPATRFVGDFVGDSNFLVGRVRANGIVEIGGHTQLPLPTSSKAPVESQILLMIRPENIRLSIQPTPGAVAVTVTGIVNNGETIVALCEGSGATFRVRVLGQKIEGVAQGAPTFLSWHRDDAHVIAM